jgi:hypothetical protein
MSHILPEEECSMHEYRHLPIADPMNALAVPVDEQAYSHFGCVRIRNKQWKSRATQKSPRTRRSTVTVSSKKLASQLSPDHHPLIPLSLTHIPYCLACYLQSSPLPGFWYSSLTLLSLQTLHQPSPSELDVEYSTPL